MKPPQLPPWPYPLWIAHRGAGKLAPENTLAAFRLGAAHGWRAFECDVKLSRDGQPFLLHDATLERTTDSRGTAGELDWPALQQLDAGRWHSQAYAGEPLPALSTIAAFCLAGGHALNIEIKPSPGDNERTGRCVAQAAAQAWQTAAATGQAPWPLLSSFEIAALHAARSAAPTLPRALLLDKLWAGCFDAAAALGCVAVVLNHRLVDAGLIAAQQAAGRRVLVYTVNDAARAADLIGWGIDGVISDAVARLGPGAPRPQGPATSR
jgi:glycerophosphoryl diester phosphodiesterase